MHCFVLGLSVRESSSLVACRAVPCCSIIKPAASNIIRTAAAAAACRLASVAAAAASADDAEIVADAAQADDEYRRGALERTLPAVDPVSGFVKLHRWVSMK